MVMSYSLRAQQLLHIIFNVGHGTQTKFLVQDGQQVRRQEARRSRPGDDVGHAEREQGQQNNDRFLLEPESTSDSGRSSTPQPSFSASVTARMMAEYASLH